MKLSFDVLGYSIVPPVPLQNTKRYDSVTPSPQTDSRRANAPFLSIVLTQGITHLVPFVTTYGIAFLIVMMLGVCLAQLALHLPSAGGNYTDVCRCLNSKAGFLARSCPSRLDSRQV
jgi:hypothetical protein